MERKRKSQRALLEKGELGGSGMGGWFTCPACVLPPAHLGSGVSGIPGKKVNDLFLPGLTFTHLLPGGLRQNTTPDKGDRTVSLMSGNPLTLCHNHHTGLFPQDVPLLCFSLQPSAQGNYSICSDMTGCTPLLLETCLW